MIRARLPARFSFALYAALWRASWPALVLLARLDRLCAALPGRPLFPARWLPARRVLEGDRPLPGHGLPTLWMHCASLGEAKGLWGLAEGILREARSRPGAFGEAPWRILLTAVTAEGLAFLEGEAVWAAAQGLPDPVGGEAPALATALAPLDHPGRVDRFLAAHGIRHVVLFEADLWPHFILRPHSRGIPVDLVSARAMTRTLRRIRRIRGAWSFLLDRLDWIQDQGPIDGERLRALTRRPVYPGADSKAAHHLSAFQSTLRPEVDTEVTRDRIAFLSLHLVEMRLLLPELPALMLRFPLTVFPRVPKEFQAFRDLLLPLGFVRHADDPRGHARHVLVDALGLVTGMLPACGAAFVGGSLFDGGCHNLWEPLRAGLALRFGPSTYGQEALSRLVMERGIGGILRKPAEMRAWGPPPPGIAAACRELVAERLVELEESQAAFRARVAVAVSRFYLFSGGPGAVAPTRQDRVPA